MAIGFGEPLLFGTMEWPRTRQAVSAATARITEALRENLAVCVSGPGSNCRRTCPEGC